MPIASEQSLNEPRIYANRIAGKTVNTRKKYVFKKINGKAVRIEMDLRNSVLPSLKPLSQA